MNTQSESIAIKNRCNLPPQGWQCSRQKGHDGPCAATPINEHGGTSLEEVLLHLPAHHQAKADYFDLGMALSEAKADAHRLQVIQDHGADHDIYAEAGGGWSIRERSGERTLFSTLRECADAIDHLAR